MRKKIFWLLLIILFLIGIYFSFPLFLRILANYLVVQDKLEPVDVIVVLGGDCNGERVEEAIRLYQKGYGRYLLMSGGPLYWKLTYAQVMRDHAVARGVSKKIILIQDRSRSTIEEAKFTLPIVKRHNFKSIILVTSPYHTRRASRVFRKVYGPQGIKVLVYPVQKSEFNPQGWWTRYEDTAYVVWEYVASVLYFFRGY